MAQLLQRLDDRTSALAQMAQPVVVALGSAGLTGGVMVAASILAGRIMRRH